jgi:flavin-dependent dehydrogenase
VTNDVDVVVVGARIAGCLTAIKLAARGLSVRLLDSNAFPSDTLSTHFFRGDGLVRLLDEVGLLGELLQTGAPPLTRQYVSVDGSAYAQEPAQEPGRVKYCLSVRRSTLDALLVGRARATGVDVRTRTKVVELLTTDGACVGVRDEHGTLHRAQVVVGADGRRSTIAHLAGAVDEERHPAVRAMYYRYATGWPSPLPSGPEFLFDGDRLAYVFPSDAGITCLAVSLPLAHHAQSRRHAAQYLSEAFRRNPQTTHRIDRVEWASEVYVGSPTESVWRQPAGPGWALIGDAGTAQDPWAGHGMDTAARQAEAFVEARTVCPGDWADQYARLRRERTYDAYEETTRLARDLRQALE